MKTTIHQWLVIYPSTIPTLLVYNFTASYVLVRSLSTSLYGMILPGNRTRLYVDIPNLLNTYFHTHSKLYNCTICTCPIRSRVLSLPHKDTSLSNVAFHSGHRGTLGDSRTVLKLEWLGKIYWRKWSWKSATLAYLDRDSDHEFYSAAKTKVLVLPAIVFEIPLVW